MLDAFRHHDDLDRLFDYRFRPLERRARWQLDDRDEIALVLLRDEAGGRASKLDAGDTDQRRIGKQDEAGGLHEPPSQVAIARAQPLESEIEAVECGAQEATNPG